MHAAGTGNEEIFDLLVKHGAKVDATFQDGRTPLYFAVGHAHTSIGMQPTCAAAIGFAHGGLRSETAY